MQFQAPESLSEQIAQHLGQRIVVGELAPGERVQELKVAGELDVSRGSVREALLILERRHLVEIFPRRGAVVSQLTPSLVNGLYDIYIELLCMLSRKVLERWQVDDLNGLFARLAELQMAMSKVRTAGSSGIQRVIDAGFAVMRYAYGLVENPFLEETLENFKPAVSRTYYVALTGGVALAGDAGTAGIETGDGEQGAFDNTERFFRELTAGVRNSDETAVTSAIRRFGEHQRQRVLAILAQHLSA